MASNDFIPQGEPKPDATPSPKQSDDDDDIGRGVPTCFILNDKAGAFDLAEGVSERLAKLSGLLELLLDKSASEYNHAEVNNTFWALSDLVNEARLLFHRYYELRRREGKL